MCKTGAVNKHIISALIIIISYSINKIPFNANDTRSLAFETISQMTECIENSHLFPLTSIFVHLAVGRIVTFGQTPQLVALTM